MKPRMVIGEISMNFKFPGEVNAQAVFVCKGWKNSETIKSGLVNQSQLESSGNLNVSRENAPNGIMAFGNGRSECVLRLFRIIPVGTSVPGIPPKIQAIAQGQALKQVVVGQAEI